MFSPLYECVPSFVHSALLKEFPFSANQALQLSLDSFGWSFPPCRSACVMPFPQHIAHMLLAALGHLSPGCCCRLKNRGIAAHIPLQCPGTNIDWRWSRDRRRYLLLHDSGFIKRSTAAFTHRTCIFARWGDGTRECSSGSWWCFWRARSCWSPACFLRHGAGRNREHSSGNIYSPWQGKIDLYGCITGCCWAVQK